jgi:hypothetical protein
MQLSRKWQSWEGGHPSRDEQYRESYLIRPLSEEFIRLSTLQQLSTH